MEMQEKSRNLSERERLLTEREASLADREKKLEQAAKGRLRDNLYDRIPVSVGTMNIIIGVLAAALVICLMIGIAGR